MYIQLCLRFNAIETIKRWSDCFFILQPDETSVCSC
jgi:hypothetical protein